MTQCIDIHCLWWAIQTTRPIHFRFSLQLAIFFALFVTIAPIAQSDFRTFAFKYKSFRSCTLDLQRTGLLTLQALDLTKFSYTCTTFAGNNKVKRWTFVGFLLQFNMCFSCSATELSMSLSSTSATHLCSKSIALLLKIIGIFIMVFNKLTRILRSA